MAEFEYKFDPDIAKLDIYVDGVEFTSWYCEENPQASLDEFIKVFNLGRKESDSENTAYSITVANLEKQLEEANDNVKAFLNKYAPLIKDEFTDQEQKLYCCEYNLKVSREMLHECADKLEKDGE